MSSTLARGHWPALNDLNRSILDFHQLEAMTDLCHLSVSYENIDG
jgi:hypothetical protein